MWLGRVILVLLVAVSLYSSENINIGLALTDDGRPPLAPIYTPETCSCTSTDGTCNMTCTYSVPPDMEASCHDKCVYLADLNCTSSTSSPTGTTP